MQSLHVDAEAATDKPALLAAVTACTQAEDALTIVIPGTEAARRDTADYRREGNEGVCSAAEVLAEFDTLQPDVMSRKSRFFGAFIIVDDADHLDPVQLRGLARHASARGSKLLLVTTDTDPPRPGPSKYLTDAAAAHLPWAQHLGATVERDTAIGRAQRRHTSRGEDDPHIAEMLDRATELVNNCWERYGHWGRHRERSRDDDYGIGL